MAELLRGPRLRICVLANARAVHTKRWAEAYALRGHEVHVLSIRNAEIFGAKVHTVCLGPVNSASPLWTAVSYLWLLLTAPVRLRKLAPDVVHAHYTITHGVIAAFSRYRPVLLTAWGSDVIWGRKGAMPIWQRWLNRYALARADLVTSASHFMLAKVRELSPIRVRVVQVPFGVDTDVFRPMTEQDRHVGDLRIGFIKGLNRKYGPEFLIRAMPAILASVPQARLVMAGRGALAHSLQKLAAELGVADHVEFLGFVPHEDVPMLMATLDVYVNCSVVPESFGVAVLEASACEVPVVVTDVGGVREVCRDRQTGLIVPSMNAKAIAHAIIRLGHDSVQRRVMGKAGRRFVLENYRWAANVEQMHQAVTQLASVNCMTHVTGNEVRARAGL